jgi:hypothetical protein
LKTTTFLNLLILFEKIIFFNFGKKALKQKYVLAEWGEYNLFLFGPPHLTKYSLKRCFFCNMCIIGKNKTLKRTVCQNFSKMFATENTEAVDGYYHPHSRVKQSFLFNFKNKNFYKI